MPASTSSRRIDARRAGGRNILLGLLGLLALLAAACGDDAGDTASPSDPASASGSEGSSGPVVVEHAYGTTTLDAVPERIVTLSTQWTGVLLAMGVQPVGHLVEPIAGPEGIYPWDSDLSEESVEIEAAAGIPIEQIAALRPDLILVTYLAAEQADYEQLAAVAPTIGLLGERQVDTWQDLTEVMGRVLHQEERAAEVIDSVEELLADTRRELPGLEGKTFALANYVPGDSLYVVADEKDGSSLFFQALGMKLDPDILAAANGASGRAQFSLEQAGLLDADMLVLLSNDGDPNELVGYAQLPAAKAGAVSNIELVPVVGLNTPSPLSIPYSLEVVLPALEAAAR